MGSTLYCYWFLQLCPCTRHTLPAACPQPGPYYYPTLTSQDPHPWPARACPSPACLRDIIIIGSLCLTTNLPQLRGILIGEPPTHLTDFVYPSPDIALQPNMPQPYAMPSATNCLPVPSTPAACLLTAPAQQHLATPHNLTPAFLDLPSQQQRFFPYFKQRRDVYSLLAGWFFLPVH